MKKCTMCQITKELSDFNKKKRNKDGFQNICRACSNKRSREYYNSNLEKHKKVVLARNRKNRRILRNRVSEVKTYFGCSKCGEKDISCLEFHHFDPSKKLIEISYAVTKGQQWEKIKEEIEKCVCLCANCHRKYHAGRFELTQDMMIVL